MKVAIPKAIDFISTNLPASTETEWAAGSYDTDDVVKDTRTVPHMLYTSPIDGNTTDPASSDSLWGEGEATNQWALGDSFVNSQSEGSQAIDGGNIIITVDSSKCDKLGLLLIENCASVSLSMKSEDIEVWTAEIDFEESVASSWYAYMFRTFEWREDNSIELPKYFESELTISMNAIPSLDVKCGHLVVGADLYIGSSDEGATPGTEDYSKITENTFGKVELTKGNYSKTLEVICTLRTANVSGVKRQLDKLRATPLLWDANNSESELNTMEAVIIYGFYRTAYPVMEGFTDSKYNFEIKGMI